MFVLRQAVKRSLATASNAATPAAGNTTNNLGALISELSLEASQGLKTPELLQSVAQAARGPEALKQLSTEQCAKLAWSFAWLNEKDNDLMVLLANKAKSSPPTDASSLVQLSWAFACADVLRVPAVRDFFQETSASAAQAAEAHTKPEHFLPLLYTCVAWTQTGKQVKALPKLLNSLTEGDLSQHTPQVVVSPEMSTQEEIATVFRNLAMDKEVTMDVMTDIDITADVAWPARKVILDCVTLDEDMLQGGTELNGMAAMKQRLLRNAGWEVHTIKQYVFESKFGTSRDRTNLEEKKKWLAEHWWPPKA